jgi:VIT1/CCC1 family predicted Fe2+/Mn2+ transporter
VYRAGDTLELLLYSFPEERQRLRPYVDRAEAYRNECGCSMGGAFLLGSLGLLILYAFLFEGFAGSNVLNGVLRASAFVFGAAVAGKLTGIGIARIRLALLYRQLRITYNVEGN